MSSKKCEKLIAAFVKMIAALGICYQVYCQTVEYLDYPSYTSIERVVVDARLPAITLCASFWNSKMARKYDRLSVLNASLLMPSYDEVMDFCHLTLPNGTVADCKSISEPHQYLNNKMTCYSLFEKGRTFVPDEQLKYSQETRFKNAITTSLLTARLILPWNESHHYAINVRPYDSPLQMLRSNEYKVWLEPSVHDRVALDYSLTGKLELPFPHGSCKNYPPPLDSDSFMVECWMTKVDTDPKNDTHFWPRWLFFDFEKNYTEQAYFRLLEGHGAGFYDVMRECMNHGSQVDCDRIYYAVKKRAAQRTDRRNGHLLIEIPWTPATQLNITNHIKTHLLDYLNEVGNILSTWVDFAIYSFYIQVTSLLSKFIGKITKNKQPLSPSITFFKSNAASDTTSRNLNLFKKANNLVMRLICWCVTLYFTGAIVMIYFERPFNTTIEAKVPHTVKLLKVDVCFDMVIHPERVKQFYPHLYESVAREKWKQVLNIEQIFKTTTDADDVFHPSTTYFSPTVDYVRIHEHFNYTKSITGRYTCFSTFSEREYLLPGKMQDYIRASLSAARQMALRFNTSQIHKLNQSRIQVFFRHDGLVHEDLSPPDSILVESSEDARLNLNFFVIRNDLVLRKLYPDHAKSTCLNYREKFGFTREILFNKCVSKQFTREYGLWPSGYQVWQTAWPGRDLDMNAVEMGHLKISNESMQWKLNQVKKKCQATLRKSECNKLFVKVHSESSAIYRDERITIALQPSSKQFLIYEQQLTFSIVDIFNYAGGTINTWIGLSFLDFEVVLVVIAAIFEKRNTRVRPMTPEASLHQRRYKKIKNLGRHSLIRVESAPSVSPRREILAQKFILDRSPSNATINLTSNLMERL